MPTITRIAAWIAVVVSLLAVTPNAVAADSTGKKPNIIFVLADDLGYGDIGCYGQKQIQTPNIDALAAQGMRFTDAYAGATVCAPSRCSLMTGLHGGHARIRGNKEVPLLPEDVTVARILQASGYATALVGKWGLGDVGTTGAPSKKGFDYFFGYTSQVHAHNSWPEFLWCDEQKVPLRNKLPAGAQSRAGEGVSETKLQYSNDLFTTMAHSWVRSNKDKPFFLYLAYTIPHANNEGKQNGIEVPSDEPYSARNWPENEKKFAASITRMDAQIGQLMSLLKELGIDQNTVVFFSSDNGPHREGGHDPDFFKSSGPLRGTKRDLYDGGIRVPMIVRWPGRVAPGSTSNFVTAFWDFLPTAADLAGAGDKIPANLDGFSIVPTLLGKPQRPHEYLYFEFHERGFDQALRAGDTKAVRHGSKGKIELYNVKQDIAEQNDIAAQQPELVKSMEAIFASARTDNPDFPVRDRKPGGKGK